MVIRAIFVTVLLVSSCICFATGDNVCEVTVETVRGLNVVETNDIHKFVVSEGFKPVEGKVWDGYEMCPTESEIHFNVVVDNCDILPLKPLLIIASNGGENDVVTAIVNSPAIGGMFVTDDSSSSSDDSDDYVPGEIVPYYMLFKCIRSGVAYITVKFDMLAPCPEDHVNCTVENRTVESVEWTFAKSCPREGPRPGLCVSTDGDSNDRDCDVVSDGVVGQQWTEHWANPVIIDKDTLNTPFYISVFEGNQYADYKFGFQESDVEVLKEGTAIGQDAITEEVAELHILYTCVATTGISDIRLDIHMDQYDDIVLYWKKNCGYGKRDFAVGTYIGSTHYDVIEFGEVNDKWIVAGKVGVDAPIVGTSEEGTEFVMESKSQVLSFAGTPAITSSSNKICKPRMTFNPVGIVGVDAKRATLSIKYNCRAKGRSSIILSIPKQGGTLRFGWIKVCPETKMQEPPAMLSLRTIFVGFSVVFVLVLVWFLAFRKWTIRQLKRMIGTANSPERTQPVIAVDVNQHENVENV